MASDFVDPVRTFTYDKKELRNIISAFKAMDDEAQIAAKRESSALAEYAESKLKSLLDLPQITKLPVVLPTD